MSNQLINCIKNSCIKVGLGTALCSGTLLCKTGVHLYCNNSAASYSNTCECEAPWTLNTATLECDCSNPLYHLSGTSCRKKWKLKLFELV
jgi:hypothetical protein